MDLLVIKEGMVCRESLDCLDSKETWETQEDKVFQGNWVRMDSLEYQATLLQRDQDLNLKVSTLQFILKQQELQCVLKEHPYCGRATHCSMFLAMHMLRDKTLDYQEAV